jgi:hypothetical protein
MAKAPEAVSLDFPTLKLTGQQLFCHVLLSIVSTGVLEEFGTIKMLTGW